MPDTEEMIFICPLIPFRSCEECGHPELRYGNRFWGLRQFLDQTSSEPEAFPLGYQSSGGQGRPLPLQD